MYIISLRSQVSIQFLCPRKIINNRDEFRKSVYLAILCVLYFLFLHFLFSFNLLYLTLVTSCIIVHFSVAIYCTWKTICFPYLTSWRAPGIKINIWYFRFSASIWWGWNSITRFREENLQSSHWIFILVCSFFNQTLLSGRYRL